MSIPESGSDRPRGVLVRKPKATIYTVLLGVALAAITIGCMLLLLEIMDYGPPWARPWNIPSNMR